MPGKSSYASGKGREEGFPRQEELQRMYGESVLKEIERFEFGDNKIGLEEKK